MRFVYFGLGCCLGCLGDVLVGYFGCIVGGVVGCL